MRDNELFPAGGKAVAAALPHCSLASLPRGWQTRWPAVFGGRPRQRGRFVAGRGRAQAALRPGEPTTRRSACVAAHTEGCQIWQARLNLSRNDLGPEGGMALAAALPRVAKDGQPCG